MADPWPAGQLQDQNFRLYYANDLYHQLELSDILDECELDSHAGMLQLPPQYWLQRELEVGETSPSMPRPTGQALGGAEVYYGQWQSELPVPSSSQLPQSSFAASQAGRDHVVPAPTSDLSQAIPLACQAQPYPPSLSLTDLTYPGAQFTQAIPSLRSLTPAGSSDFCSLMGPLLSLPLAFPHSSQGSDLQQQAGSDGLSMYSSPSQGYDPSITQLLQYEASASGSYSTLHAQEQHQFLLGSFNSTEPFSVDNGMTQMSQRTRNKEPNSKQWSSSNTTPRNVPCARKSKTATLNRAVFIQHDLLTLAHEEIKTEMMCSTFEKGFFPSADEITTMATNSLNVVVQRFANEDITNWQSMDGARHITKLKGTVTTLHRDFAERIGNFVIIGFQLTFRLSSSKADMDVWRNTRIATILLDDSFRDGDLQRVNEDGSHHMYRVPFAHPVIIDSMEEMLLHRQYCHFIPFHVNNDRWVKCLTNSTCFIAAICRWKLRQTGGMNSSPFPSQDDRDWYSDSIKDIESFTRDKKVLFEFLLQAMRRMVGF
ncbi:hypothetical protein DFH29DRAFT_1006794 [Suillus ampliporus]|nr:hypothetical protein DFH29DRAFT_1006794 [Suillus ampliporus]